ncbi:MAG TPA: HAMP domain-containing sensor histidine kinase [Candidatus Obscuribacterales bacterium]
MFRSLRLKLTLWFVCLAGIVYLLLASVGGIIFYVGLTRELDDELSALATEMAPLVYLEHADLRIQELAPKIHGLLLSGSTTAQLFRADGVLDEQHGNDSINKLYKGTVEFKRGEVNVRSRSIALKNQGQTIGFLQVQVPTVHRDISIRRFFGSQLLLGPLLLTGLAFAGYLFSGVAVRPVEKAFAVLRMFVADAGHELKTPVSTIQATAENLAEDVKDRPELIDQIAVISRATERMGRLVQDMLLLAKMEVKQQTFEFAPCDVKEIASRVVQEFEPLFKEQGKELKLGSVVSANVSGDRDALHRLLSNLVENALRYSDSGDKAEISVANAGNKVRIDVADSGIGIAAENLPHIFDRFYRVDSSRSRAKGGSGLGLAIVKAIVEVHQGTIKVDSEIGKGTTFSIVLPAA